MITPDILTKIAPSIKGSKAIQISEIINNICPLYGINTTDILHEFLANILVESGEFARLEEGLNYQSIALQKLFSRKRISMGDTINYGRTATHKANPVEIANRIYGGDWGRVNLGNIHPMDGWIFRGAGIIQITGRANTTNFTNYHNQKFGTTYSPEQMADLLRTDLSIGIHSACWIFAISFKLIDEAVNDSMKEIVKRINGGYTGLKERMEYYRRLKLYLP